MDKQFPVLNAENYANCPTSVPWSLVAPHEKQAEKFHGQTLERLAERGGLAPEELVAVLADMNYYDYWKGVPQKGKMAVLKLKRYLNPQEPPATATVKTDQCAHPKE